jgi:hypothetical protein
VGCFPEAVRFARSVGGHLSGQPHGPNAAPVYDVLTSFSLTLLCDGRRFVRVQRLGEDPTLNELFGLERVVSDDTLRRFVVSVPEVEGARWVAQVAQRLWSALPQKLILDWDSTVQTKYGRQEGAAVGYNPQKRGRKSFHPLLAVAAGTRLCPYYRFRSGDTVGARHGRVSVVAGVGTGVAQSG